MNTNPLKEGPLTQDPADLAPVTRKMARERAVELAATNGRSPQAVSKSGWEQAKRELASAPHADSTEAILEAAPAVEGENAQRRSDQERLVEEGAAQNVPATSAVHQKTVSEAKAEWQNEGNPNGKGKTP